MKRGFLALTTVCVTLIAGCSTGRCTRRAQAAKPMLAHNVYFTLKDGSEAAKTRLVNDCFKYLKDQPGVVFFAAGSLADELDRPVNVRDFDVGLHIVFKNMAAHDAYQVSEKHQQFVKENRDSFNKVRVYDTKVR